MIAKNHTYRLACFILLVILHFNGAAQLTIIVDKYPEREDESDDIYISGNFEGWSGGILD